MQYTSRAAQLYKAQLEKDVAKLAKSEATLSPSGTPTADAGKQGLDLLEAQIQAIVVNNGHSNADMAGVRTPSPAPIRTGSANNSRSASPAPQARDAATSADAPGKPQLAASNRQLLILAFLTACVLPH